MAERDPPSDPSSSLTHIRSPLARAVYHRIRTDTHLKQMDHSLWYEVDVGALPEALCSRFLQSGEDEETQKFLENCYEKSDWMFTQIWHLLMKSILSWFITQTTINGWLKRGSMFVFSEQQFLDLLDAPPGWMADSLLDLGAGDGEVTSRMAAHFQQVHVTELSTTMLWRLQERGYHSVRVDEWSGSGHQYDVISCLNVIDRCDKPLTLLRDIRRALVPGTGRAVIAMVIPFSPYVEFNKTTDHQPTETLHIEGATWERQVASLAQLVFLPLGLQVERFTRLPYLCEGDLEHSFYLLDDVVFVLRAV